MSYYDIIIKNAKVVDGSGSPWFYADVGVNNGKIEFIGKLTKEVDSKLIIDAEEKVLSPGFIDSHTHFDFLLLRDPIVLSKLEQGVTTIMIGACGISPAPIVPEKVPLLDKYVGFTKAGVEPEYNWETFGDYLNILEELALGLNIASFLGHGTIRINVMGLDARKPTTGELEEMKRQVQEAMLDGAFGMTTGLIYPPGVYSEIDEIVELAKVVKGFNGVYLSHIRNESNMVYQSVKEVIAVAENSGVAAQVHHHKACGEKNWGLVRETIQILEEARGRGIDVTIDQYPYSAASTTLRALMPPWANEGGIEKIKERLQDKDIRDKIINEIHNTDDWDNYFQNSGGAEGVLVLFTPFTPEFEGKNLVEIGNILKKDPLEAALDIIVANNGSDTACYFMMDEKDVKYVMKSPLTMVGSDSIPVAPGAKCHPRTNGTFPRVLGKYVREEQVLTLEEAVKKMTSFPATRFNLKNKGLIKEGMDADLVIFDPDIIRDGADYEDPFKKPVGISQVIVNGELVLNNGEFTGKTAGKVLRSNR